MFPQLARDLSEQAGGSDSGAPLDKSEASLRQETEAAGGSVVARSHLVLSAIKEAPSGEAWVYHLRGGGFKPDDGVGRSCTLRWGDSIT